MTQCWPCNLGDQSSHTHFLWVWKHPIFSLKKKMTLKDCSDMNVLMLTVLCCCSLKLSLVFSSETWGNWRRDFGLNFLLNALMETHMPNDSRSDESSSVASTYQLREFCHSSRHLLLLWDCSKHFLPSIGRTIAIQTSISPSQCPYNLHSNCISASWIIIMLET